MKSIKKTIPDKKIFSKANSDESYRPRYILEDYSEEEMVKNSAYFKTTFGVTHLSFNTNKKKGRMYLPGKKYGHKFNLQLKVCNTSNRGLK